MPVRLRIALLFTISVTTILLIVGSVVYYISYHNRLSFIKTRLTNRANNIANFLTNTAVFHSELIQKIDASTAGAGRDKELHVFDRNNTKVYGYSDRPADTVTIDQRLLNEIRSDRNIYFTQGKKEAIGIYNADADIVIVSATDDETGKKSLLQLKITLWLSLLGGAVISLAGGYFFAGRLLRPIRNIADKVNEISAKSLAQRIPTGRTRDEWHYLSSTLNQLLNRLQQAMEMHRRFISNASHELFTPLTSISNRLEVSLQRDREAEDYKNVMQSIHKDVLHMNKLTQTLLEFAQASGGDGGLEIHPVRVDEVLLRLPAELARLNSQYTVMLEFDDLPTEEDQLLVFGNEELLFTAVKNIVINACKYSSNKQALVKLYAGGEEIRIDVIDNGPGISSVEMTRIFQPFYRGESVGTLPGFGLGLSLTSRIIKLHKGRVSVKSDVDKGTVFTILLPAAFNEKETPENETRPLTEA